MSPISPAERLRAFIASESAGGIILIAAAALALAIANSPLLPDYQKLLSTPVAFSAGSLGLIEKAAPTLAAAHSISSVVDVPVLCASGLSAVTVPMAIAAGASGVGVGSAVNRLNDPLAMVAVVRGLRTALHSTVAARI